MASETPRGGRWRRVERVTSLVRHAAKFLPSPKAERSSMGDQLTTKRIDRSTVRQSVGHAGRLVMRVASGTVPG